MPHHDSDSDPSSTSPTVRVLVVDEDPDTLVLVGKLLSTAGIDAVPVATCADAHNAAQVKPFTLVICERKLPDGDGLELCWMLKLKYGYRTIMMSDTDRPAGALPMSVDLWLKKPVGITCLRDAIERLLLAWPGDWRADPL
jgi:DNA-binding response OmpR family regulator